MDWYFVLARHTSGLGSGPGLRPRLQSGPVALVLISEWGGHGECRARVYTGGLGAQPPAWSRDRAPG